MNKYKVTYRIVTTYTAEVKAENEQEAKQKFKDEELPYVDFGDLHPSYNECESVDVIDYDIEELFEFPIPTWAIGYLANADATGLTDEEYEMCKKFDKEFEVESWGEDSWFDPFPAFGLACDCSYCKCRKRKQEN